MPSQLALWPSWLERLALAPGVLLVALWLVMVILDVLAGYRATCLTWCGIILKGGWDYG